MSGAERQQRRDNTHYAEALGLLRKEQWEKAAAAFGAALRTCPTDTRALLGRSRCRVQLGLFEAALVDADALIELEETIGRRDSSPPAQDRQGSGSDDLAGGVQPQRQVRCQGLLQKAATLYAAGDFERALVYYHRGARLRPDVTQFRDGVLKAEAAIERCLPNRRTTGYRSGSPGTNASAPRRGRSQSPTTPTKPRVSQRGPPAAGQTGIPDDVDLFGETAGLGYRNPLVPDADSSTSSGVEAERLLREATTSGELPDFREDIKLLLDLAKDPLFSNTANLNNVFPNRWRISVTEGRGAAMASAPEPKPPPPADGLPRPPRLLQINNNNHPANMGIYSALAPGKPPAVRRVARTRVREAPAIKSPRKLEERRRGNAQTEQPAGVENLPGRQDAYCPTTAIASPPMSASPRSVPNPVPSPRHPLVRMFPPGEAPEIVVVSSFGRRTAAAAARHRPTYTRPRGRYVQRKPVPPTQASLRATLYNCTRKAPSRSGPRGYKKDQWRGSLADLSPSVEAEKGNRVRKRTAVNTNKTKHLWTLRPQDRLSWDHNDSVRSVLKETLQYLQKRRSFWRRRSDGEGCDGEESDRGTEPTAARGTLRPDSRLLRETSATKHRQFQRPDPHVDDRPPGWTCARRPVPPAARQRGSGVTVRDVSFDPRPVHGQQRQASPPPDKRSEGGSRRRSLYDDYIDGRSSATRRTPPPSDFRAMTPVPRVSTPDVCVIPGTAAGAADDITPLDAAHYARRRSTAPQDADANPPARAASVSPAGFRAVPPRPESAPPAVGCGALHYPERAVLNMQRPSSAASVRPRRPTSRSRASLRGRGSRRVTVDGVEEWPPTDRVVAEEESRKRASSALAMHSSGLPPCFIPQRPASAAAGPPPTAPRLCVPGPGASVSEMKQVPDSPDSASQYDLGSPHCDTKAASEGSDDWLLTEAAKLAARQGGGERVQSPVTEGDGDTETVSVLTRLPEGCTHVRAPRRASIAIPTRKRSAIAAAVLRDRTESWRQELERESDTESSGLDEPVLLDASQCAPDSPRAAKIAEVSNTRWMVEQLARIYKMLEDGDVHDAVAAARILLGKLGDFVTRTRDNARVAASLYDLCGTCYMRMNDYVQARNFFMKQVMVCKQSGSSAGYARAAANLAAAYKAGGVEVLIPSQPLCLSSLARGRRPRRP